MYKRQLILGTVIGLTGGLLFAPSSGHSTRKVLGYRIRRYTTNLQELIRTLSRTKATTSNQAKLASQEVIEEAIRKAQELLQDVDELATQLE